MGAEYGFKFLLLYLLLVMCVDGKVGARDDSRSEEMHGEHAHDHPSSHMDHMDHSVLVFFTLNDLKVGRTMPIYFPKKDPSRSPRLLPREDANSIPFSYDNFPYLLQFFSFSNGSPQARAMEDTLGACETKPIKGEVKFCATSLESMLDFVRGVFGLESQIKAVSTTYLTQSSVLFQNYTILAVPKEVPAPTMVACHTMPYPYAVFYCHSQETENKVFVVSLIGENGDRVEALAVCHLDTSQWGRNHVSFKVLGIEPGSSNVCHFFPEDNLVLDKPSQQGCYYPDRANRPSHGFHSVYERKFKHLIKTQESAVAVIRQVEAYQSQGRPADISFSSLASFHRREQGNSDA